MKTETFLFTFGDNHCSPGTFIRLKGSWKATRQQMLDLFGSRWAFQYKEDEEQDLLSHNIKEISLEEALKRRNLQ